MGLKHQIDRAKKMAKPAPKPDRIVEGLTEANLLAAADDVAAEAKRRGMRITLKPTKLITTPAAQEVAAAHGMTVQELYEVLARLSKKREARREYMRAFRAKQKGAKP